MNIPDTSFYMNLGFALSFLVMALYAVSLYIRRQNLTRDISALEEMEESRPTK